MRVVIKPAGIAVLLVVFGGLAAGAFLSMPRTGAVEAKKSIASRVPTADVTLACGSDALATLTLHPQTITGLSAPVPVATVSMTKIGDVPSKIVLHGAVLASVTNNQPLHLWFRARSLTGNEFSVHHEEAKEPFTKSVSRTYTATPAWKEYDIPFRAVNDYAPGGSQLSIHCGTATGTLEFADIRLTAEP